MVANLLENVRTALEGYNITGTFAWSDSTFVLCWILSTNREWKQFVTNRIVKIRQKENLQWKYCPTGENPADIGSRGCKADNLGDLWWKGPEWLANEDDWSKGSSEPTPTKEVTDEEKVVKQLSFVAVDSEVNQIEDLLNKFKLWKVIRVVAWIRRFINNCRSKLKRSDCLVTREIQEAEKCFVKISQNAKMLENDYIDVSQRLGLAPDEEGILRCRGRVTGEYPVYIPTNSKLARSIIEDAHERTLHGGVTSTMAKIRERWWIERLRRSVKSIISKCYKCLRYRAKPFSAPATAPLPEFRTQGSRAFETVGVDFAGPLEYKVSKKKLGKAYVALYTCATSRAVHLHLLPDMTADEFKRSLGEFIARRGLPARIVSDNGKTFVATAKWMNKLKRNHKVNDFLARRNILWVFNLARSPWWGGFFERMVGLMKSALRKAVGRASLTFDQLKEVLMDVEVQLNNRPLGYMEDDVESLPLTPNVLIHGANISLPEEDIDDLEEDEVKSLSKRAKYIQRCKDAMWKRWTTEYIRSLRERRLNQSGESSKVKIGEIVLIKGEEKDRGQWKIGVIQKLVKGRDGVIRGAKLKTVNGVRERPLQLLYPMELHVSRNTDKKVMKELNPEAEDFQPRKERAAKTKAKERLEQLARTLQDD